MKKKQLQQHLKLHTFWIWGEIAAVTAVILLVRIIEKNQGKPQGTKENHWESWRQELVEKLKIKKNYWVPLRTGQSPV